jgi:hypothetical protein
LAFDYATLGDVRVSQIIRAETMSLLAAREQLPNHPVLAMGYAGDLQGSRTTTVKQGFVGGDGYDVMAAVGDGVPITPTDLTDDSVTVSVARQGLAYRPTDGAINTGPADEFEFARWMVAGRNQRLVGLVAAQSTSFTNSVGSTGINATVQDHLDAKRALHVANAQGPLLAVYHPTQWADILDDLNNNASGALQYEAAAQELRDKVGNGLQGTLAGVTVWTSTRIPTANAGADRAGMMLAPGALIWADMTPRITAPAQQALFDKVLFDIDRRALEGDTAYVGAAWLGVSRGLDGAGVGIITDA